MDKEGQELVKKVRELCSEINEEIISLKEEAEELKEDKVKYMDIKEFWEKGYLQEVNRRFFHPLGLALEVYSGEEGSEVLGGIWDYREDPEGNEFALNDPKFTDQERLDRFRKNAEYIDSEFEKRRKVREKIFGNIIEPIPE